MAGQVSEVLKTDSSLCNEILGRRTHLVSSSVGNQPAQMSNSPQNKRKKLQY
jgi:hypothetical protein